MFDSKSIVLALSIKYNGDFDRIYQAICAKERVTEEEILKTESIAYDTLTLMHDNYPEGLKSHRCPPFAIFLKGNRDFLSLKKINLVLSNDSSEESCNTCLSILSKIKNSAVIITDTSESETKIAYSLANKGIKVILCTKQSYQEIKDKSNENILYIAQCYQENKEKPELMEHQARFMASSLSNILLVGSITHKGLEIINISNALDSCEDIYCLPHRLADKDICNELISNGANIVLSETTLQEGLGN